jgi:hypothetical protein
MYHHAQLRGENIFDGFLLLDTVVLRRSGTTPQQWRKYFDDHNN